MRAKRDDDFIEYVHGRLPGLRRIAAQLAGDPHLGDDLVQQTITRLYLKWRRASRAANLDAYVYRMLVRAFLDERRLSWASVRLGVTPAEVADPSVVDIDDRLLLRDALATLPPRQRAVVVLRYLADRSVEEVAEILQISPGTVKSQTHDGVAVLRRLLTDPARTKPGVL